MPMASNSADVSEGSSHANHTQTGTGVARVGVDFLDPTGVEELRRALTEHDLPTGQSISDALPDSNEKEDRQSTASSGITLAALNVDEGLDLEKTFRHIVRK
jgi:hypothetical protein